MRSPETRSSFTVRFALGSALALTLGGVVPSPRAAAQDAGGEPPAAAGFGERVDVTLVNVDVWVTDRQGGAVTGLGAGDFEVRHNGEPVPISNFIEVRQGLVVEEAAPSSGPAAPGAAAAPSETAAGAAAPPPPAALPGAVEPAPPAPPSHLVVYFDQSRLHPTNNRALVEGVEELLESGAAEPGRVLILRQDFSLTVEAPFGSSRDDLAAALDRLAKGSAAGMDLESEGRLAQQAVLSAWEQAEDSVGSAEGGLAMIPSVASPSEEPGTGGGSPRAQVGGFGSGGGPDACGSFLNQVQPILESWIRSRAQRVAVTLANLSDAASFLAGLPGVKVMLYLSDGLDTQPGIDLATFASDLCPGVGAELLTGAQGEGMTDRFLELTRHANANRVTIHALQATGLRSPGSGSAATESGARGGRSQRSSGSFEARKRAAEREGLGLIARETGGRSVFNRNEFGPAMVEIGEESRNYYSLAYRLPPAADGRRSHKIEVRVADKSLNARYRQGYLEKSPGEWLTERIEGALNLGITDNALAVRLGAGAVRAGEEGTSVLPLQVMVPAERLAFLPGEGGAAAEVHVKVLARSLESQVLAVREVSFRLKGAPGSTGLVTLPVELTLGSGGAYLAAVGVQDRATGEASFISTTLSVGAAG